MTWTAALCEAVEAFDPEFRAAVVPASLSEIEAFAGLVGRPLPQDYIEFLALMGLYDGGLLWTERVIADLPEVADYCERRRAAGDDLARAPCLPIAVGVDFDGFGLNLDPPMTHPPVVALQGMRPVRMSYASLPAMAFTHAFLFEQGATGRIAVVNSNAAIDELQQDLIDEGYGSAWFSTPVKQFLRKGAALLTLHAYKPERLRIYLGGRGEESINEALRDFGRLVGRFSYEWGRNPTLPEARADRGRG